MYNNISELLTLVMKLKASYVTGGGNASGLLYFIGSEFLNNLTLKLVDC